MCLREIDSSEEVLIIKEGDDAILTIRRISNGLYIGEQRSEELFFRGYKDCFKICINNHARLARRVSFYIFDKGVIYGNIGRTGSLAVISRQKSSFPDCFRGGVYRSDDYMGARHIFNMEPEICFGGKLVDKMFILAVVASD